MLVIEIGLKLLIRQFIALFEPAIIRQKLLDCIVREVNTGLTVAQRVLV